MLVNVLSVLVSCSFDICADCSSRFQGCERLHMLLREVDTLQVFESGEVLVGPFEAAVGKFLAVFKIIQLQLFKTLSEV